MPTYVITDPASGVTLEIEGPTPPPESVVRQMFAQAQTQRGATPQPDPNAQQDATLREMGALMPRQPARDFRQGAQAGLASTIQHGGDFIRRNLGMDRQIDQPDVQQAITPPPTTAGQLGFKAEQAAEYFAPAAMLGKAKTALKTGSGILDLLIGAGLEGASAAGVQTAQQGDASQAGDTGLRTAAAVAVGTPLITGALKAVKGASGWLSERVENALVKASTADYRDGFQASHIFKHNLGGSLSQTYDKTQAAITKYGDDLQKVIQSSSALGRKVNLLDELTAVATDLEKNSARTFGQNDQLRGAIDKLLNDPLFQKIAQNGDVDLATANQVKQALGEMGAWLHDPTGRVIADPSSRAMETVANSLYSRLKTAIERESVGPVREINRNLSELLAVRHAIIRRIPVEQRQNVLNMGDLLSFSTGAYGLALANRVVRSGQFANAAAKFGQAVPSSGAGLATTAGRVTAAVPTP